MSDADKAIEAEIQAKGLIKGLRVTPEEVEDMISKEYYFTADVGVAMSLVGRSTEKVPEGIDQVTICVLLLKNGHKIIGVNEGPINPENFDPILGRKLARAKATDQIWPLLGFQKRTQWYEAKRAAV
jgi:hypothetical protein